MSVELVGNIEKDITIWRYMSLDKFIHLLDTQTLFFTCLDSYSKSDPFEGYPPMAVLQVIHDRIPEFNSNLDQNYATRNPTYFKSLFNTLFKQPSVNCWHANDRESEAMWKIYGDNQKGIAIKTTVENLMNSIETSERIRIGKVSYTDYENPEIADLMDSINSGFGPLIKRKSYSHENEIRAFFRPLGAKVTDTEFKSHSIKIDTKILIQEILISPFSQEPYGSAVKAIAKQFNIEHKVKHSKLLETTDGLFSFLPTDIT
ncbi:hypothetical protein D9M69_431900 [compost metagenome]